MPKEAAWPLHRPGAQLGRHPSAALLGPSAPALPLNAASILPIREEEWLDLTTDVKERLRQARSRADASVDEAFRMYQGAHAIYVRQLITELRREVETAQADATTDAHRSTLKGIDNTLDGAMGFLSANSPHEAAVAYDEARAAFTRYQQPYRVASGAILEGLAGGGDEDAGTVPTTNAGAPTGGVIPTLPEAPAGQPALGEFEGLPLPAPRHMWMVELGVLLLLTGVAVALGLQLLSVFSPAWGGFGAGMTAFLWGFGLHQVGNATFEGLTGLLTRVEKHGTPGKPLQDGERHERRGLPHRLRALPERVGGGRLPPVRA